MEAAESNKLWANLNSELVRIRRVPGGFNFLALWSLFGGNEYSATGYGKSDEASPLSNSIGQDPPSRPVIL